MGLYLEQYEKENMRTTMLWQEETFVHQVRLHLQEKKKKKKKKLYPS